MAAEHLKPKWDPELYGARENSVDVACVWRLLLFLEGTVYPELDLSEGPEPAQSNVVLSF